LKKVLKDITRIQTGVYAKADSQGEVTYLQAQYFNEAGEIDSKPHPDLRLGRKLTKHLLKSGDVLFAAKGNRNFAAIYEAKLGLAVASSTFFVIRLNEDFRKKVRNDFLAWFLNQPQSQQYLKSKAIGTSLPSISKPVLESLEIAVPTIAIQKAILKIYELQKKEKQLKQQIEELRERQMQYILLKATDK
jgi:restriction endonuclease S subunit